VRNNTLFNIFLIAIIVTCLTTLMACTPAEESAPAEVTAEPDTTDMPADVSDTAAPDAETGEEGDLSAADAEAATEETGEETTEDVPEDTEGHGAAE
jgi:hypothetical protein